MRKANTNDLEKIKEIIKKAKISLKNDCVDQWQRGNPDEKLLIRQISSGKSYVLEKNGEILAYAFLSDEEEKTYEPIKNKMKGENYFVIHTFCVDTDHRGEGLASIFFDEIIKKAKKRGKDCLRIDTHEDNFRMRSLISKMNFSYVGEIFIDDSGVFIKRFAYELVLWLMTNKKK